MKDPKLLETMKDYKGRDEVPADFDAFWNQALVKITELLNTSSKNEISAFQM